MDACDVKWSQNDVEVAAWRARVGVKKCGVFFKKSKRRCVRGGMELRNACEMIKNDVEAAVPPRAA